MAVLYDPSLLPSLYFFYNILFTDDTQTSGGYISIHRIMNLFFFVHIYHQIESEIGSCSNHHDPPQLPQLECQLTSYSHFALSLRHSHFSLLLAGCSARSHKAPSLPLGFMPLGPHNDEALFRHCTLLRHGSGIGFPVPIYLRSASHFRAATSTYMSPKVI